jgi:hypothetical protein
MTRLDDIIKQVRDYDAGRPRSTQQAVGWSEVGGCRAYLGFKLDGTWPSDETDTWAAQRGTAIHEYLQGILGRNGVRVEIETIYRGIPGHADLVDPYETTVHVTDDLGVDDIKTTTKANSEQWAAKPALLRPKRIQAHGYAAGLVATGQLPKKAKVRLIVIPVDGTFDDWWMWEEEFDQSLADEGADRLEDVRDMIARGETPPKDKPYAFCERFCQFFSLCRSQDDPEAAEVITDLELAAAIAAYGEAVAAESAAKKVKEGLAPLIRGLRGTTADGLWRISLGKRGDDGEAIDEDAIRADYFSRGQRIPMVATPGNKPRLSVTKIKPKAAAKPRKKAA